MSARPKQIVPGVYQVTLGMVHVFLLEGDDGVTVVDAGVAGAHVRILAALAAIGRQPDEVAGILVSHAHPDHTGGLAGLRRSTCAQVWMHGADAALVRRGLPNGRGEAPGGRLAGLVSKLVVGRSGQVVSPAPVHHELEDGDLVPLAGGVRVIHTPGHTAGHLSFLLPQSGGVLLAGDAAVHYASLRPSMINEDRDQGMRSLAKLAELEFEVACFAHGSPIRRHASQRFRRRWGIRLAA